MWGFFRHYVRQLVLIVVLAGFVDMLLPLGQMRKFAQVVVGLFIIMALLDPLLLLFQQDITLNPMDLGLAASTWEKGGTGDGGRLLAEKIEGQVIHHYQRRLEEQVRALVLSLEGVNQARAQVFLETKGGQPDFGGISKIKVWVGLEKDPKEEYKVVEEIKVRIGGADCEGGGDDAGGEYQVPGEMREEITSVLTAFYTVDPQRVSIYALEGDQAR